MENNELLNLLRQRIESFPPSAHYEIFRLIQKNKIPYNENSNGIFINMINMNETCISELQNHLKWLEEQKNFLQKDENMKKEYRENFFNSV
jgi:hypothetical protein